MRLLLACLAAIALLPLRAHAAAFPYITLNETTNRLSDSGSALTYNGSPLGGGDTTWTNVPGSLTLEWLGYDDTQGGNGTNQVEINNEFYFYTGTSRDGKIRIDNGYGSPLAIGGDNTWNVMIGVDIMHGGGYTNLTDLIAIGDDVLFLSTPANSGDIIAIGDSALNGSVVSSASQIIAIGLLPLRGATLTNSSDIIAIGKSAGINQTFDGKSHIAMLGSNAKATNSNDFVFGDNTYNYFFPGAAGRIEGTWTAATGLGSTATDSALTMTATGRTNTLGKLACARLDGTNLVYVIKNSANSPIYTNSIAVGRTTEILQAGGALVITSGSLAAGNVNPL